MRYLGVDVHSRASVWCLLDEQGEVCGRGHVETTGPALESLVTELSANDKLRVGQDVGTMAYLVHDAVTGAGAEILSFNAYHLRMIASSRKKTDRRDAYWIARALQTGMHPHPVYMATGEIRELRALLSRRRLLLVDRNRWQHRARSLLRGCGLRLLPGSYRLGAAIEKLVASPTGLDAYACESLELCQRQQAALTIELRRVEAEVRQHSRRIDAISRLQTIPAVGPLTATAIYAWVARFPNAKTLAAYAGLVPEVRQSGGASHLGSITKMGAKSLRSTLVQASHVLISQCRTADAAALQAIAQRVRGSRGRRKIAVVALARHLLRIAYYILRDATEYEASRLEHAQEDRAVA